MAIGDYSNFGGYVNNEIKPNHDGSRPLGKAVSEAAHAKNEARKAGPVEEVGEIPEAPADVQQDQAIIEATVGSDVTLSASNEPVKLTVSAVIANLNEVLAPDLGPQAIEAAYDAQLDVSPEATADRIVSLTTAMFSAYQTANPDLEGAALVDQFVDVIAGGIEQGFSEARTILDDMGVLEGDIASNIDSTFDLVMQGLEKFREENGGTLTSTDTGSDNPADPAAGTTILSSSEA
ncbi:DUF5610 domain-containing protein [Neptuniibacter halophilus]|uniref:DUF5610 domain-containing protein n=1 Tax=Neptuniibacter halophilus TaxID=651666 RepID=UPI0025744539|nr:DUF5610 domain-containing protein [Neptuniibacter halophilus]